MKVNIKEIMKKHLGFCIAFPIVVTILTLFILFYLDMAAGPIICLIIAIH